MDEQIHQLLTAAEAFYASGDMKSAFENYREAALKGSSEAAYRLGVLYEKGNHVKRDFKAAMQWYYTAAKKGSEDAKNRLSKGLPKTEVKPEEESTESTIIVAQNNETIQESKPAPEPVAATKPITPQKNFSTLGIQFCIAGCVKNADGFRTIASYGYYTDYDICQMDTRTLGETQVYSLRHTEYYISYSLRDNSILPIDSSRCEAFTFNIRIKRDLQLANQISPYTVLIDMYKFFMSKYMTSTIDGKLRPTYNVLDNTEEIYANIKKMLDKYSLQPRNNAMYIQMNPNGETGTLCIPIDRLEVFFRNTNYPEFAQYSSVEIGSACATSMNLRRLEIPRMIATNKESSDSFISEWNKIKEGKNIFAINSYRSQTDINNPLYPEITTMYEQLRMEELTKIRINPSVYYIDELKKLIDAGIFTKGELIYENVISERSLSRKDVEYFNFPNENNNDREFRLSLPPKNTDIYLFGTTTGKTSLLMGLYGAEGRGILFGHDKGKYVDYFQTNLQNGVLPGRNIYSYAVEANLTDCGNVNFIDVSSTDFMRIVKDRKNAFEDMDYHITEAMRNQNRKCFLFLVDCENNLIRYSYQDNNGEIKRSITSLSTLLSQFVSLLSLPENKQIMKKVDSIHFIVTKSDLLGYTVAERNENAKNLLLKRYNCTIECIRNYFKQTKHINASTEYNPCFCTFSLGKFYVGDYKYDITQSVALVDMLRSLIKSNQQGLLDRLVNKINVPLIPL